jgi:hypothetical protein
MINFVFIVSLFISYAFSAPIGYDDLSKFEEVVSTKGLKVTCWWDWENEGGLFWLTYHLGPETHEFSVYSAIDRESCKAWERDLNKFKQKHTKLILFATEKSNFKKHKVSWRWRSLRTLDGKECESYFIQDCDEEPSYRFNKLKSKNNVGN